MKTSLRFLLVAAAVLLPLGCGVGQAGSSTSSRSAGVQPGSAQAAPQSGAGKATSGAASQGAPSVGTNPAQLPEGTRVQRSAQLLLQVAHGKFDAAINGVLALVDSERGFVAGVGPQPVASIPDVRTGQITFQVPTERFDDALVALRKLGTVKQFNVSGVDVSSQYVDLQSRLASAQAQRDAYLALLNRAQSIQDIVTLQNQLAPILAQIEQLKGQIDNLDRTTTYGTITATIQEGPAAGAANDSWGVATAFGQAVHNFVAALDLIVLVLGTTAPFLLLFGGLGFLGWRAWDRRRRAAVGAPGV